MAGFSGRIAQHQHIGFDTAVFIYQFEQHPRYLALTDLLIDRLLAGQIFAVTSVVTLMEVTVLPLRQQRPAVARQYELVLTSFQHLRLLSINRTIARTAGELRAEFRLSTPDALQAATVLQSGATAFVTNDLQMRRLHHLLDVIILDDFA